MSEKKTPKVPTLEENFAQIQEIIEKMEQQETSLDESFLLYQQGIGKLKNCNQLLDAVEKKMQVLNADGTLGEMEM